MQAGPSVGGSAVEGKTMKDHMESQIRELSDAELDAVAAGTLSFGDVFERLLSFKRLLLSSFCQKSEA